MKFSTTFSTKELMIVARFTMNELLDLPNKKLSMEYRLTSSSLLYGLTLSACNPLDVCESLNTGALISGMLAAPDG